MTSVSLVLSRQVKTLSAVPLNQSRSFKCKVSGNGYYVNAIHEAWRLHVPSMQWSLIELPHNASTLNVAPADATLTATVIQRAFSKLHVSTDGGANWLRRDTTSYPIYDVDFSSTTSRPCHSLEHWDVQLKHRVPAIRRCQGSMGEDP